MAFGYNISQRKINKRNHIIDLFRQHNILSKAKAKKLSAYSMDTVISIFKSLQEDNIIIPAEGQQKSKGRKANFFILKNDRRIYLGITLNQSVIISSVVSFSQEILAEHVTPLKADTGINELIQKLKENVSIALGKDENYPAALSAVGCSIPGDIDVYNGVLRSYTFMPQLNGLNFREVLSSIFPDIPVILDHNIRSMTSYILRDVELVDKNDKILFVSARSGPANSFIYKGQLVVGHGEIGHIKVSDEKKKCICGRDGCLDCYFSINSFMELLPEYNGYSGNFKDIDTATFLDAIKKKYTGNDPVIKEALDTRLRYFSLALLDVINLLSPDLVILSGDLFSVFGNPVDMINEMINDHFRSTGYVNHFRNTRIICKDFKTNIASLGICYEMIKNDWGYQREGISSN